MLMCWFYRQNQDKTVLGVHVATLEWFKLRIAPEVIFLMRAMSGQPIGVRM
jgi:hypothetical protein